MLTLDGVVVNLGEFRLQANLTVEPGHKVAIIGPSGSGKSTLLAAVGGLLSVSAGHIRWGEEDLTKLPPGARPMSILFQDNNLFPHLSAWQNVAIGLQPSMSLKDDEMASVRDAFTRVGLAGYENRKPGALSGGQQSRVALARMLVRSKPLVLLDEPFSALGPALRGEMLDLVAELAEATGATLLMVTHEPADAERICEQTIFVEDGTVQAPQDTAKLFSDPPAALRSYLGG